MASRQNSESAKQCEDNLIKELKRIDNIGIVYYNVKKEIRFENN